MFILIEFETGQTGIGAFFFQAYRKGSYCWLPLPYALYTRTQMLHIVTY